MKNENPQKLLMLSRKEMLKINGGGQVWEAFGKLCKKTYNFLMEMANASSQQYHMGMM